MKSIATIVLLLVVATINTDAYKWTGRPTIWNKPLFARFMIHNAQWGVVGSYSPMFKGPFGIVQSIVDGPVEKSSGVPYFYIAKMSTLWQQLKFNNTASLTISEAQSDYCEKNEMDPMEPTCARLMLTGKLIIVTEEKELSFSKDALMTRHPAMKAWPGSHGWTVMKLDITSVNMLNFYGGMTHIPVKDYFAASF